MGTGLTGIAMESGARTQVTAAIRAISTMVFVLLAVVDIISPPGIQIYYVNCHPYHEHEFTMPGINCQPIIASRVTIFFCLLFGITCRPDAVTQQTRLIFN